MNAKTKAMDVPDIGNLLGKITDKRDKGELGVTERQHVTPVLTEKHKNTKTEEQKNIKSDKIKEVKTNKAQNELTPIRKNAETSPFGGRPTLKNPDVEYVRLGVRIPKHVEQQMKDAVNYERFTQEDGKAITTLDELMTLALERLLYM